MNRIIRTVNREVWSLSPAIKARQELLLEGDQPEDLIEKVLSEALERARAGAINLEWQASNECPGFFRLLTQIQLREETFDQLFNGRAGYRAQYYLSPEEGVLFNRDLVEGFREAISISYDNAPLQTSFQLVEKSLLAPHSKIWIFREQEAFSNADADIVNPSRWVENRATQGRKAPLPAHLKLDLKGTFIHPETCELFVDEYKLDRACDLFKKGYT